MTDDVEGKMQTQEEVEANVCLITGGLLPPDGGIDIPEQSGASLSDPAAMVQEGLRDPNRPWADDNIIDMHNTILGPPNQTTLPYPVPGTQMQLGMGTTQACAKALIPEINEQIAQYAESMDAQIPFPDNLPHGMKELFTIRRWLQRMADPQPPEKEEG